MNDVVVLLVVYGALFISSPLIAILHELGHAFAYLIFTKPAKIDIYIGSYGSTKNSFDFKTGKLHFHIKKSLLFIKGIGLCASEKNETNYRKYIIILVAGACFTFISAAVIALFAFEANAHFLVQVACYIFLGLSFLSLLSNLVPRDIRSNDRDALGSDGSKLRLMIQIKDKLPQYLEAIDQLHQKDYIKAAACLKSVLEASPENREILNLLIPVSLEARDFSMAEKGIRVLENKSHIATETMFYRGCLYSLTGMHDEAIDTYSNIINKKDKNHLYTLNNLGYELIEKGAHQVAARALERAIKLKPEFYEAYATLGYSKILQGDLEEGKKSVKVCLELSKQSALAYKALGIYHLKLKNIEEASANFEKAAALDEHTDLGIYYDELKGIKEPA